LARHVALLALLALPTAARADGDPASDYLITQRVFLPYDTKIPKADQERLQGIVLAAAQKGFPIRVALIASPYDLGSVTVIWREPQRYARFLGVELSFIHKTPLLTVMPNGLGFYWSGHDPSRATAVLTKIPVPHENGGLARAGIVAVKKLAAAYGVKVEAPAKVAASPPASHQNRDDRLEIIAIVAALLVIGAVARLFMLRRRRSG
jgi:hypothetical protein